MTPDYSDPSAQFPDNKPRDLNTTTSHDDSTDRDSANPDQIAGAHMQSIVNELRAFSDWTTTNALAGGYCTDEGGLTLGYTAGRLLHGNGAAVTWSAGTLSLTDNATNYVEVDSAGAVSANTSGFTSGRLPLATVVTSGGVIDSITDHRAAYRLVRPRPRRLITLNAAAQSLADATALALKRWIAGSGDSLKAWRGGLSDASGAVPSGLVVRLENYTDGTTTTLVDGLEQEGDPLASVDIGGDDVAVQVYNGTGGSVTVSADLVASIE